MLHLQREFKGICQTGFWTPWELKEYIRLPTWYNNDQKNDYADGFHAALRGVHLCDNPLLDSDGNYNERSLCWSCGHLAGTDPKLDVFQYITDLQMKRMGRKPPSKLLGLVCFWRRKKFP